MAQRTLDSSFWDDERIALLSFAERLLYACMFTDTSLSDDFGRLPAAPRTLKKHAFGYDDGVTIEQVREWRDTIIRKMGRSVVLYEVAGQEYLYLTQFAKWQQLRYKRRTNIPDPPGVTPGDGREGSAPGGSDGECAGLRDEPSRPSPSRRIDTDLREGSAPAGSDGECAGLRDEPSRRGSADPTLRPVAILREGDGREGDGREGGAQDSGNLPESCANFPLSRVESDSVAADGVALPAVSAAAADESACRRLWVCVDKCGIILNQATADQYQALLDEYPIDLIEEAFREAAATGVPRPGAKWLQTVLAACLREGRRPGAPRGRPAPSGGARVVECGRAGGVF